MHSVYEWQTICLVFCFWIYKAAVFDFEVSDLLKKNLHTPSEFSHFPQKKKL